MRFDVDVMWPPEVMTLSAPLILAALLLSSKPSSLAIVLMPPVLLLPRTDGCVARCDGYVPWDERS